MSDEEEEDEPKPEAKKGNKKKERKGKGGTDWLAEIDEVEAQLAAEDAAANKKVFTAARQLRCVYTLCYMCCIQRRVVALSFVQRTAQHCTAQHHVAVLPVYIATCSCSL